MLNLPDRIASCSSAFVWLEGIWGQHKICGRSSGPVSEGRGIPNYLHDYR